MTTRRPRTGTGAATAGQWPVAGGTAEIVAVTGAREQWLLRLDGIDQSHVDLADPTHLAFDYIRWIGHVIDLLAPAFDALHTVHVGAGAATLARYVAATRPASRQVLLDPDEPLLQVVRDHLGLRSTSHLKLRAVDGRDGLAGLPAQAYHLVIRDAFAGMAVPPRLLSTGFTAAVTRVLAPGGCYVANLSDRAPFDLLRAEASTALQSWRRVLAIAEPATWRGRRTGNVILVASDRALPLPDLARRLSGGSAAARLLTTAQLRDRVGGRQPLFDGDPVPQPPVRPTWM